MKVALKKLMGSRQRFVQALTDINEGRLSYSTGDPILLSKLDNPKGLYFIIDGYHRVIEAFHRRESHISAKVDDFVPYIQRVGGAYNDQIADKVMLDQLDGSLITKENQMKEIEISFNVSGNCYQKIKLVDDCPLTVEEIIDSLNGDEEHAVFTTTEEGGNLLLFVGGDAKVIGEVVGTSMDAGYTDFNLVAE